MSPEAQSTLQEIVAIARDGKEFYEYAAMVTPDPSLGEGFSRLARAKSDVIAVVGSRLSAVREPEPGRREFRIGVRASLTDIRASLGRAEPGALLGELARLEEHLIYHYTWVLAGTGDESTRRELGNLLPLLKRCRDEIAMPAGSRSVDRPQDSNLAKGGHA